MAGFWIVVNSNTERIQREVGNANEGKGSRVARSRLSEVRKLQLDAAIKSPRRRYSNNYPLGGARSRDKKGTLTSPGPDFISLSPARAIMPSIVCIIHVRVYERARGRSERCRICCNDNCELRWAEQYDNCAAIIIERFIRYVHASYSFVLKVTHYIYIHIYTHMWYFWCIYTVCVNFIYIWN